MLRFEHEWPVLIENTEPTAQLNRSQAAKESITRNEIRLYHCLGNEYYFMKQRSEFQETRFSQYEKCS
jgi:hypothetical protein